MKRAEEENDKAVRHNEQPKYKNQKLENVYHSYIKKPLKFSDIPTD